MSWAGLSDSSKQLHTSVQQQIEELASLQQHGSALPAICRAVFRSGDTVTLSVLYDLGRQYIADSNGSSGGSKLPQAVTACIAAWTLLQDSEPSQSVLRQVLQNVFLPLVVALGETPDAAGLLQQVADLLVSKQAWQVALEVLQCAHGSVQSSLRRDSTSTNHRPCQSSDQQLVQAQLPPTTACALIKQLVAAASSPAGQSQLQGQQAILQLAAGPVFDTALQLLCCADSPLRQAAFQQLLPELLRAAAAVGPEQHRACRDQLLQQCLEMLACPVIPRRMGLAVLLQHWSDWQLQPPTAAPAGQALSPAHVQQNSDDACSGHTTNQRFWQLLRECLVDPEPLNRKRALRLLQLLLPKAQLQSEPVWGVFIALYELLDEFTPHLVKATWPMVSHLHRPAPTYAAEDPAADVRSGSKINPLGRGLQAVQPGAHQQEPLAFAWSSIIWTQALQHTNLQVQRMAMRTLLKRDWSAQVLQRVPASFITQVLLPALLSPVHYNTQPVGQLTSSGAVLDQHKQQQQQQDSGSSDAFDITQHAAELLSSYVLCAEPAAAREVFNEGLEVANRLRQDASRAGLQSVLHVLAAAAEQLQNRRGLLQGLTAADAEAYAAGSLRKLQLVLTRITPWHGTSYKVTCCSLIARIAAAVAPPGSCSLATCARLLQELPMWMLCPGGGVGPAVRTWLAGSDSRREWLQAAASSMWKQYLAGGSGSCAVPACNGEQQQPQYATAPDYAVWRVASDSWLRVMLSCGEDLQALLASVTAELAVSAEETMSRSYLPTGLPDRVLIMIAQLLEVGEAACRAATRQSEKHSSQAQPPANSCAALQFAAGAGSAALLRLLKLQCACYYSSPAELAGQTQATAVKVGAGARVGLSPSAWQACARAECVAQAAAAAVVLMAEYLAAVQSGRLAAATAAYGGQTVSAATVLPSLVQLGQQMAAVGQSLAAKPLPCMASDMAAGEHKATWGAAAAAAECSRASAVKVLRYLSEGLARALSCPLEQHWPPESLPFQPAAWVGALVRETAAAAAATTHWEPALAAAGATGDIATGWVNGLDYVCLDACMAVIGLTSSQAATAPGCGAERLPKGALSQDLLAVTILVEALNAVQWTPADVLVHLMRCVRRIWALAVQDSSLQAAALVALDVAGLSAPSTDGPLPSLAASLARSLLQVLHGNKKRPLLLCGCLINTLLLPEVMLFDPQQQPELAALHVGPDAPLRQFVGSVLQHGTKGSPTVHLVVALRLGACIPAAPYLLEWYAEQLQQLLMFSCTMEGGIDSKLTLGHEAAIEWALLAEPLEPHLANAGVAAGMGPRIAVVAALHQLAAAAGLVQDSTHSSAVNGLSNGSRRMAVGAGSDNGFAAAAVAAGVGLWRKWIEVALHDPVLGANTHRNGDLTHRNRVRLWQGLAATVVFLGCPSQQEAAKQAAKDLLAALETVNPPSVKQYQEASLTYLVLQHQHLIQELLLPQLLDLEKGSPATASHILAAVQACLHSNQQEQLLPQLVNLLVPWTNHHTHNIRTFGQLGLCAVLDAKPLDSWPGWQKSLGEGGVAVVQALQRFFVQNLDFQRFRKNIGAGMLHWQPDSVVTPAGIFCSSLSLAGYEEAHANVTFEGCTQSLMDTVVRFLHEERGKLREAAVDKAVADAAAAEAAHSTGAAADSSSEVAGCDGLQLDYQRKVTPSERAVLLADILEDAYEAAQGGGGPSAPAGTRRLDLVVVASLIDKVPNLAGLARTAEVLGAGTLVLSDLRVAADSVFKSISVTAERWVPMLEVKEAALLSWLKAQKAAGYSLVGLEQTAESTQLPSFKFPYKTVLVLGREKEGVPPEIIALLDATVEIPQLGVIRSLNVHVSGAIAMYEYTKQQLQVQPRT